MQLQRCAACGGGEFTGTVVVTFNSVPITLDPEQQIALPDWMEGHASEDEVISATCSNCGAEAK